MKTLLAYDTETTGFPLNDRPDDHPGQPKLVEFGARLFYEDGTPIQSASLIVKPDGWTIPEAASKVHGITTEMALRVGVPYRLVVAVWTNLRAVADELIAHNEDFDDKIMRFAEHHVGYKRPEGLKIPLKRCTARLSTPIVNLPPTAKMIAAGFNKPKTPNLGECVRYFFNEEFVGAHRADADVMQCARVFFELKKRGAVL